ncbi:hypothetical protein MPSEU_000071500 [Mayamaea pseudoterrestris]|nr:hypothetical protein MPSEU_000071500 [Mayamaea pseudoterrestris]
MEAPATFTTEGAPLDEPNFNKASNYDAEIDSALQAALRDPRERLSLLKLEQSVIDFVNSAADWLEVGGLGNAIIIGPSVTQQAMLSPDYRPATSFQRCICHRLADRFNIVRENGVTVDGFIRLIKLPDSRIPTLLLQNVDVSVYDTQQQADAPNSLPSENGGKRPQKMKLMKRKDSNTSASSKQSKSLQQNRSSGSLTDKERAYEEARARIFGPGSEDDDGDDESASNFLETPTSQPWFTDPDAFETAPNSSSSNLATLSSSSTNIENKAIYRNRLEEAADPDFRRGVAVYAPAPYVPVAATAVATSAPTYPFVSQDGASIMYPSSIFTAAAAPAGYYYPPATNIPVAAGAEATTTSAATTTTDPKATSLTADSPAFYPFGQSTG